jgi:cytochrome c biogenesis protein CcmG, thiol:disulfide interchange protein DsbE
MIRARRPKAMRLVLAALVVSVATPALADIGVGDRAPDLDVARTETGKSFKLKQHKGEWLLLTFGGSWCKPCAKELPAWDKLAPKYKSRITMIAVNIDNDIDTGKKFNQRLKIKHLTKVYLPADTSAGDDQYETGTFPSTFIIDPKGIVRHVHKGYASGDSAAMVKTLDGLLP